AAAVEAEEAVAMNVPSMVWERVLADATRPILREKQRGVWRTITWGQLGQRMRAIGQGLRASDFAPGEIACVLAETRPDWVYADLGIQGAGGVAAGIYPGADADLVADILRDCAARVLFVENEEQLDKALHARDACPALERIVILDMKGLRDLADPMCESLDAFVARGEAHDATDGREWEAGLAAIAADSLAVLIYTAGTTGAPKGVMLSHAAILAQVENAARLLGQNAADERLAFMPMGHVMERVLGLYLSLYTRSVGNYVESVDTILDNLQEIRPTVLIAAPHSWERFHARISLAAGAATLMQRSLFRWAMAAGMRRTEKRLAGQAVPAWTAAEAWLLGRLVLGNVRRELGLDRLRLALIGAAPVSAVLIRWFMALGIDLTEIYGQTECAGLAAIAGRPVPYGEVAVAADREVLVRGPHVFMGYWNRPRETALALRDGWLHTGDLGGFAGDVLTIIGRRQDVITTSTGAAVTAGEIEKELKVSPYIADAMLFGDGRAHLSCLVMVDHDAVEKWAQAHKVAFTGFSTLVRADGVRGLIEAEIARACARLPRKVDIRSFRLIEQKLEPEDPELTPVMKLRRGFVGEKYSGLIEEMYTGG
ncbi:MAG: long-chain fatty acid--CoA ligase, partial [Acetobacteraceae bacterium]